MPRLPTVGSGGRIKFDLKAGDSTLHRVLTGVSTEQTLANFARAAVWVSRRPEPAVLTASSLMVPGDIDQHEIRGIARFIAARDRDIAYSLLGFYPPFRMADLPATSPVRKYIIHPIPMQSHLT